MMPKQISDTVTTNSISDCTILCHLKQINHSHNLNRHWVAFKTYTSKDGNGSKTYILYALVIYTTYHSFSVFICRVGDQFNDRLIVFYCLHFGILNYVHLHVFVTIVNIMYSIGVCTVIISFTWCVYNKQAAMEKNQPDHNLTNLFSHTCSV